MKRPQSHLIGKAGIIAALLALGACGGEEATGSGAAPAEAPAETLTETQVEDRSAAFLAMADEHAEAYVRVYPEAATRLGLGSDIAGEGHLSRLGDYGFAGHEQMRALNERFLQELRAYSRDDLEGTALATYDVLRNAYETAARRNAFLFGGATPAGASAPQVGATWAVSPYLVTQLTGPHLYLPRMLETQHPIESRDDIEAFLARLSDMGRAIDGVVETVQADAGGGVVPPVFAIEGSIGAIESLTAAAPEQHPIAVSLVRQMQAVEALSEEARGEYAARAAETIEAVIYPAYARLAAALDALRGSAGEDAGVWRLGPEGEAFYQMALDAYGAAGMTADDVHELGLAEVERISAEMDAILRDEGLAEGSIAERLANVRARPDETYPNTDEGREALLEALRGQVSEVMTIAPDWFQTLPPQSVEVRRIPVHEQDGAPGGYYSGPSLDGSRPGIYWINLKDTADNPKLSLKTLTYHEAVPGHHFQISLQLDVDDMPLMRNLLSYSEYTEGWALYGEALAKEMGMYEGDPLGDLGRLQAEIFRAARLVVDTGLHHKRWTREQAIDYMVEATGETRASVTREVERYAVIPGQATSYKLGMLKIQAMRAKAETELGDAFDIRAFHDEVLLAGAMPIAVLEARVNRWIEEQKAK